MLLKDHRGPFFLCSNLRTWGMALPGAALLLLSCLVFVPFAQGYSSGAASCYSARKGHGKMTRGTGGFQIELACTSHGDCAVSRFCSALTGADGSTGASALKGGGCEPCRKCEDGTDSIDVKCPCSKEQDRNEVEYHHVNANPDIVRLVLRGKRGTKLIKFRGVFVLFAALGIMLNVLI